VRRLACPGLSGSRVLQIFFGFGLATAFRVDPRQLLTFELAFPRGLALLQNRNCLATHFLLLVGPCQPDLRVLEVRMEFQCAGKLRNCLVVAARQKESRADIRGDDGGKRVKFSGSFHLGECLIKAPGGGKESLAVPVMCGGIIRIQGDGCAKLSFCSRPIPIVVFCDKTEGGMRFRQILDLEAAALAVGIISFCERSS
jgi:hypothetical protein